MLPPSTEELSKLLLTLYGAPTRPELWPKFLSEVSDILGLGGAALLFQDLTQPFINLQAVVGFDPSVNIPYESYYSAMDQWRPLTLSIPPGQIAMADELCPPQLLKKTEFYNDFLRPFDINLLCAVPTVNQPPALEIVTFYHRGWGKPCDPAILDTIKILLPHVQCALRTRQHLCTLEARKQEFSSALDLFHLGVVLIGEDGQCFFVNQTAKEVFDQRDGLRFRSGRMWADRPSESAQLQRLVRGAVRMSAAKQVYAGGGLCISRLNRPQLRVFVSPFAVASRAPAVAGVPRAAAIVFISDPSRKLIGAAQGIQRLHGLTDAETKLLGLLLSGHSLSEAAELNCVTRDTVRTQIKAVFAKTGARRQSDLVRIASALPRIGNYAGRSSQEFETR